MQPVRTDTQSEQWRAVCEARSWLKQGYTTPRMVQELHDRIRGKRGIAAADQLVADMRDQWRMRSDWFVANTEGAAQ